MDMLQTAIVTVLLNTFTGTKAWVSGWTIGPSDYRTFGLSIQNRRSPWLTSADIQSMMKMLM